jgi:YidC/Oxa1 family membrane protein insertase
MDKRFIVALALALAVIVVFQVVFPAPKPPVGVRPDSASAAATAVATPAGTTPPPQAGRQPAVAGVGSAPSAPGAGRQSSGVATASTTSAAPSIPADTTEVHTSRAIFRMSNVGAAPIGVTMADYKNLRPGAQTSLVDLGMPGVPMIRYRVIAPHDTLDLSTVMFQDSKSTDAKGSPVLTYRATVRDAQVTISYTFDSSGFLARVAGSVEGTGGGFLLASLPDGFRSSEADTVDDQRAFGYVAKRTHEDPQATLFDKLKPGETKTTPAPVDWVALKSKYFVVGLLAPDSTQAHPFAEVDMVGAPRDRDSKVATIAAATAIQELKGDKFAFDLYAGPQEWRVLHAVGRDFDDVNPYGGFFHVLLQPFVTLIVRLLMWMHEHLSLAYGWVIIILGLVVRVLLWPLNQRAMRSQIKMQVVQPELQAVQAKYKNDLQKQQEAMMKVYKEHNMSPFSAFSGCLPMLIPLPVLFTLYFVLRNTIALRGVPFLWLHDITQADPYYILPIAMAITSYLVSWIGLRNTPPNPQTKMMSYMFPAMMLIFFFRISAGLNLYYAVQNLATLPQQWLLARERAKGGAVSGGGAVSPARVSRA